MRISRPLAALLATCAASTVLAQTPSTFTPGATIASAAVNAMFASKVNTTNGTATNLTLAGNVVVPACPTSDPGATGQIWCSNGQLIESGYAVAAGSYGSAGSGSSSMPLTTINASGGSQAVAIPSSGNAAYAITLTANCAVSLSGGTVGQEAAVLLTLTQDSIGGRSVSFVQAAAINWVAGAPTLPPFAGTSMTVKLATINGGTSFIGSY